jgi:plastocyanin
MKARHIGIAGLALAAVLAGGCSESGSSPEPAAGPVDGQLVLVAEGIALKPAQVAMDAGTPLTVTLDNRDTAVPHDLVLYGGGDPGIKLAATEIVTGPAQAQLSVPPLVPGTYRFSCTVHPNMTSTLTVSAG